MRLFEKSRVVTGPSVIPPHAGPPPLLLIVPPLLVPPLLVPPPLLLLPPPLLVPPPLTGAAGPPVAAVIVIRAPRRAAPAAREYACGGEEQRLQLRTLAPGSRRSQRARLAKARSLGSVPGDDDAHGVPLQKLGLVALVARDALPAHGQSMARRAVAGVEAVGSGIVSKTAHCARFPRVELFVSQGVDEC